MEHITIEECCDILDSRRIPITASERRNGRYPYYGANGIQDYVADYIFDDELVLLAEDGGNFGSKTRPIAYRGSSKRVFVEDLKESGIPFYRGTEIGALAEGKTVTPELFISKEHYAELCIATGAPNIGDLLMPSICPDGRIWVVNTEKPFYFKDGRVLWVHAIDDSYNPVFLLYTLKDRIMSDYSSIASGTTFAELKIFALKECHVFDVPLELQILTSKKVLRVMQELIRIHQAKSSNNIPDSLHDGTSNAE